MKKDYTKRAEKDIDSINEPMESRLRQAIEKLPAGDVKSLKGHPTYKRLRVGGYRVIFDEDVNADLIVIISIKPRGQVYKDHL